MAITVTKQVLAENDERVCLLVTLVSGAAADVTDQELVDVAADLATRVAAPKHGEATGETVKNVRLLDVCGAASAMGVGINWVDTAGADELAWTVPEDTCAPRIPPDFGGLTQREGLATKNGNLSFSTVNAAIGSHATLLLTLRKRYTAPGA